MDSTGLATIRPGWKPIRVLGRGGEGTVYLVEDVHTKDRYVVKIFHKPRTECECIALVVYADRVAGEFGGLPKIDLIRRGGRVWGVSYDYCALHLVHHRLWAHSEHLRQALVGAYCMMQRYLIARAGMVIWDAGVTNFLMARDGTFHWVDFGWSLATADHPWNIRNGFVGYGFAELLLSVYGVNIRSHVQPSSGYAMTEPCRYCMDPRLEALSASHGWLGRIVDMVGEQPASLFLDAAFYSELAAGLPTQVAAPRGVIVANTLLRAGGRIWSPTRRLLSKAGTGSRAEPNGEDVP